MSRAYVERRLRQIEAQQQTITVDSRAILWSLTAGCWMLCDFERGRCERLTEVPRSRSPQTLNPQEKA